MAIACLLSGLLLQRTVPLHLPRLGWVILLLGLLPWVQFAIGVSPFAGDALNTTFYFLGTAAAIGIAFSRRTSAAELSNTHADVLLVILAGAMLSACIGVVQWLALQGSLDIFVMDMGLGVRVSGNLAQPNQMATLLLMGIAGLFWVFETSRIRTGIFYLGLLFISVLMVLTQSRAGLLSVVVMVVFLGYKKWHVPMRWSMPALLAWLVSVFLLSWLLPSLFKLLLLDGSRGVSFTDSSGRWLLWSQFAHGIWERPWLGYGWNQSVSAQMVGAAIIPGELTAIYAHNLFLDLLAWNGLPVGLLLTAMGAWWLIDRSRRIRSPLSIVAMTCLLPLVTHSLLEFPFAYSYFLLPAGLLVGLIEAEMAGKLFIALNRRVVGYLTLASVLFGSLFVYEYFLIEEDFRIVRFENMRIGTTPVDYEIPNIWFASHMRAMLAASRVEPAPGMTQAQITVLRDVAGRFAYGALSYRYALALALNDDPIGATKQMIQIRGFYGENQYQRLKAAMKDDAQFRYPQLNAVLLP